MEFCLVRENSTSVPVQLRVAVLVCLSILVRARTCVCCTRSTAALHSYHTCTVPVRTAGTRADVKDDDVTEGEVSAMTVSLTSHQYKSYNVIMLQKITSNIPVQLG